MLADVRRGLIEPPPGAQRELPPKYFYDHRGSELFEEITHLPEYYLTRTERALLATRMPRWMRALQPGALVELGAGNADKTRAILDAMRSARRGVVYVPVDVSATFLDETAARLRRAYPDLGVVPLVADFAVGIRVPPALPRPVLYAFLGSTIGNFTDAEAEQLLARLRHGMSRSDRLLLGADLVKDPAIIERAYNDSRGVTAAFNRNMLRVLNHELGADFDAGAFAHRAFFAEQAGRIEMHLVATVEQEVTIPGLGRLTIPRGDSIRTEISNKYSRGRLEHILRDAGFGIVAWETDDAGGYALLLAAPTA
jgi:L-histidine N-alpha-methyltransferase